MLINNVLFKRDTFLNARVPRKVKEKFSILAKTKSKTMSEFILELVLQQLERDGIQIQSTDNNLKSQ